MRLAEDKADWVVGFEDECWWSRAAQPNLHTFSEEGEPLRLVEQSLPKDDSDPKAISCYGLYMPELKQSWLRFVDGRPVSTITTQFLEWCCQKLEELGKRVWVLIWDNASWHISREVRRWIGKRNREVKNSGSEAGVRIATCLLPKKSPWLNAIGAQVDPWQTQGGRARRTAGCLRAGRASLRGFRLSALRTSIHSRKCRLSVH
jgi:hypothetical protein